MNIVFIHQNAPGQWRHVARHLAASGLHRVILIGKHRRAEIPGAEFRVYTVDAKHERGDSAPSAEAYANFVAHGLAVARVLQQLKQEGFIPDVIAAHPAWGESMFAKDVFPHVPLLHHCEYFYRTHGADHGFLEPASLESSMAIRARNTGLHVALAAMDWGVSPTFWQKSLYPAEAQARISVVHEGIDTDMFKPDSQACFTLPNGIVLTPEDEVVTYVARNLDTYRGTPTALRAAARLQGLRASARVLIIGGDGKGYGSLPDDGRSWKETLLEEIDLDPLRTHFLGRLGYDDYLRALQVSSAHMYLTIPFVLSWSMTEAMSTGCLVIGSDTAPVCELIRHGENGLLTDFFDANALADTLADALKNREALRPLRAAARATIVSAYDQRQCVPTLCRLLEDLATGALPPRDTETISLASTS
ncbi:glycosyltransferase [Pigmentiphaga aceris]|uniref:Glycosyltransferase n=1 Tax=Pigmentiphaga aceris TaxID=1940612 RepID=A0A5C0AWE4_9BURK|nr:glycosyltransferase [Pigmentiphaga aceris]QEI06066.1 glycosyltransferase [Pigmentiphaga aceris]